MARSPQRRSIGLGYLPDEARHGFLIDIPKGTGQHDVVLVSEHREVDMENRSLDRQSATDMADPDLRVAIDRSRWNELAPAFYEEANRRLRANGLPILRYVKSPAKPVPVHPSLGKELCVLCWAVEDAPVEAIPNALLQWEALAPEERWWLYTITVATTGQAQNRGAGWRRALRHALAESPFVKSVALAARQRKEMLGHAQMAIDF